MTDKKLQQKLNDSVVCAIVQSGKEQNLQISAQELRIKTDRNIVESGVKHHNHNSNPK
jgi:hypothetical protein